MNCTPALLVCSTLYCNNKTHTCSCSARVGAFPGFAVLAGYPVKRLHIVLTWGTVPLYRDLYRCTAGGVWRGWFLLSPSCLGRWMASGPPLMLFFSSKNATSGVEVSMFFFPRRFNRRISREDFATRVSYWGLKGEAAQMDFS